MATNVRFLLNKTRPNQDGKFSIYFCLTHNKIRINLSLNQYVKEEDWNDRRQKVDKTDPNCTTVNAIIRDLKFHVENNVVDNIARLESLSGSELKELILQARKSDNLSPDHDSSADANSENPNTENTK